MNSEVVSHISGVLEDVGRRLASIDDPELYGLALLGLRRVGETPNVVRPQDSCLDAELEERLSSGWFRSPRPYSPQCRHSHEMPGSSNVDESLIRGNLFVGHSDKPEGALWTSSLLPDGTSAWTEVEDVVGDSGRRPVWVLEFDEPASRIFTIATAEDYLQLVGEFPERRLDGYLTVNWVDVAKDYDAVHLTASGLLDTHATSSQAGAATVRLWGWDAECTAWLRHPRALKVHRKAS